MAELFLPTHGAEAIGVGASTNLALFRGVRKSSEKPITKIL